VPHVDRHEFRGCWSVSPDLWPIRKANALGLPPEAGRDGFAWLGAGLAVETTPDLSIVADERIARGSLIALCGVKGAEASATVGRLLAIAWRRFGLELFSKIDGEFAIVIADRRQHRLVMARDALGQRPLFFQRSESSVAFSSRPSSLAQTDGGARPDLVALTRFLSWLPETGTASFLQGVERVEPGSFIEVGRGFCTPRRWWTPSLVPVSLTIDEGIEAVAGEIERAVDHAMGESNVPVAAQLSGGLDSSIVVAAASRQLQGGSRRLLAVTADLSDTSESVDHDSFVDEGRIAAATVASLHNVDHLVINAASQSPFTALDPWIARLDRPTRNACNLGWLDATFAAARERGAVRMLVGNAGNHGVSYPGSERMAELARSFAFGALRTEFGALRARGASVLGILAMIIGPSLPPALMHWLGSRGGEADVFANSMLRRNHPLVMATRHDREPEVAGRMGLLHSDDPGLFNASVAERFGLEIHDPLGARRVLEQVLCLPGEHFFHSGIGRQLARGVLSRWSPSPAATITGRGYQGGNWRAGFEPARAEMLHEIAKIDEDRELADLFDTPRMTRLVEQWPIDGWHRTDQVMLYRAHLMPAIGAARWARMLREQPGRRIRE